MYRASEIRGVHLEMTTRCNARCPMCPRNLQGGATKDYLPIAELSLEDIRRVFPEDLVRQLGWLYMCGNYGDAMAARDTLEAYEYFRATNKKMNLKLFTNGGGRDAAWWSRLARVIDSCTFGIDGLEDTNHLYRRGVDWRKLMASVKAYVGAGGRAEWDFIVFRHNEHQIEQARALSRGLGFAKFNVKKTERFLENGRPVDSRPVLDLDGREEYRLELPTDPAHRNGAVEDFGKAAAAGEDYAAYLRSTPVDCKVLHNNKVFVSGEGYVFPCCWTAKLYDQRPGDGQAWRLISRLPGGLAALDARRKPLREIVDGPYFQTLIPGSWEPGSEDRDGFTTCARVCGVRDYIRGQRDPEPAPEKPAAARPS